MLGKQASLKAHAGSNPALSAIKNMNKEYNKIFLILFLVIALSGVAFLCFAQSNKSYYYDSIEVDIKVNQDGTFNITEKQTYNLTGSFGYFYRDIEIKDFDYISDIEVYDSQGIKVDQSEYDLSYRNNSRHIQWNFNRRSFNNETKSWIIKYKINGGLGFYNNYDEIYWNAIFANRDVSVKEAEVTVVLPEEAQIDKVKMFIGFSRNKDESDNYRIIDSRTVEFKASNIDPYQFLTIAVSWPKGIVNKPFLNFIQILNWLFLLIAVLIPGYVFIKAYKKWRRVGKDPKIDKTIIAQYEPPENLVPGLVSLLINQRFDVKVVTATIINLAVRGYLKIREKERRFLGKKYIFEKISGLDKDQELKYFEQNIVEGVFGSKNIVSSSDLRNKFYRHLPKIKKGLHQELDETEYITGNIQEIRKKYALKYVFFLAGAFLGIILGVIMSSVWIGFISIWIILISASFFASGIIGLVFSNIMPSLTDKGAQEKWKWLGFKEYLHTAERFRLGAETAETFSKYLPYAVIFDVEKEWADRFADLKYQQPNWYVPAAVHSSGGNVSGVGSFAGLTSSISSFASSISNTFSSTPGGSGVGGGGGAGGGGGGGGGGAG